MADPKTRQAPDGDTVLAVLVLVAGMALAISGKADDYIAILTAFMGLLIGWLLRPARARAEE